MIDRLRALSPQGRLVAALLAAIAVVALALVGATAVGGDDGDAKVDAAAGEPGASDEDGDGGEASASSTSIEPTSSTVDASAVADGPTTTTAVVATTAARPGSTSSTSRPVTPTTQATVPTAAPPATSPPATQPPAACATANAGYAGTLSSLFASYRSQQGLPAMQRSSGLDAMAQQWAERMACDGQMKHRGGTDVRDRTLAACPTCVRWAENVAFNFNQPDPPQSAWSGWLGSAPHLDNIRKPYAGVYGFGAARGADGQWYFAQNFGWYS